MSKFWRYWTLLAFAFIFVLIFSPFKVNSTLDHSNLGDPNLYKIVWKGPLTIDTDLINEENVIDISTKSKHRYKCIVPEHGNQLNFDTSAKNSSSKTSDASPIKVLEPLLKSSLCSYRFELYWTYELCHGKFLRQYHEENSKYKTKITQEYFLGKIEPEQIEEQILEIEKASSNPELSGHARPTILVNGHHKPYVMFNMTGGTKCDLTKKNRVARIIYVCNDDSKIELYSIKEVSTCEYEAIVLSSFLCNHKDFSLNAKAQREIQCYSIGDSPKRLEKSIDADEEEEKHKRRGVAYFRGKTLVIDADLSDLI